MAQFDVFSIWSKRNLDDGGVIIVFEGEMTGSPAIYHFKIEGSKDKPGQTPIPDARALNADDVYLRAAIIVRHNDIEVGPDRMTAQWRIVTDQGQDVTFRLTRQLLEQFAKYLEDATVRPATH